jgi:hypothetical protein
MAAGRIPEVKEALRGVTLTEAREIAERARRGDDEPGR